MQKSIPVQIDAESVIKHMTESILLTSTDLDAPGPFILYANPAFEKMTGWKVEEIIGKSPRILQGPKTEHSIFNDMRDKLESGESWSGRTVNYRKDGSEFHMDWSITPIYHDGAVTQYLAVQKEVSHIVKTERKLQEARSKEIKRTREIEKINKKLSQLLSKQKQTLALFSKYVPEAVVRKSLAEDNKTQYLSDHLDVALLFCDIRGFTELTEGLPPNDIVQILNVYYSIMSESIQKHDGVINQFVGDEIFIAFGAPTPIDQPELSAVQCAQSMIGQLKLINDKIQPLVDRELIVGIGINYGPVIAGNLGSDDKLSYNIAGNAVVTAKRIESLTRGLRNTILVSSSIYEKTKNQIQSKPWGKVEIKGKDEKINVYQVLK